MTKEEFTAALGKMAELPDGRVDTIDCLPEDMRPYRYGTVKVKCSHADALFKVQLAAALAVSVGGYLTMNVFADDADIRVAISRELDEEEIRVARNKENAERLREMMKGAQ